MKKKQNLFPGFTVIAITVIFTIAGCTSTGEFLKPATFPSEFIGIWERVDHTKFLIFTPSKGMTATKDFDTIRSTMKDSSQSHYWVLEYSSGETYTISPSYDSGMAGKVNIKLVGSYLEIPDDYLAGNPKYDWTGTWRRINDFDNLDYNPKNFALRSYGLKVMVEGRLVTMADITGYTGSGTSIFIPSDRDGLMITNIAARAFTNKNLAYVYFPRTISTIEAQAFANNKLTDLNLPNNIRSIGNQAFNNNPLTSITIGPNVDFLGSQFGTEQGSLINSGADDTSSIPIGYNFEKTYIEDGRKAGTYTRPDTSSTTWTRQLVNFPTDFVGTWKRDNFNNTLTFTATTLKPSNQSSFRILSSVYGDSYTYYQNNSPSWIHAVTIKLVNDNLVISGDSGDGEDNWNGTWKKVN